MLIIFQVFHWKCRQTIRPLVLILPKMSRYIKTFNIKDGNKDKSNTLISFRINDEKLLGKYEPIWTKVVDIKLLN